MIFSFQVFTVISFLLTGLTVVETLTTVKVHPMTNVYFNKIYKISLQNKINYLHISCKQQNLLSISLTPTLDFHQHPRYPVFDQFNHQKHMAHNQIPRMQRNLYTFLSACPVQVQVNDAHSVSENDPLVTIKRKQADGDNIIFSIKHLLQQNQNYTKIQTTDPSMKWGLGERFQDDFAIRDGTWTVYNRDRPWEVDKGSNTKSAQTYGHQPVYLARNRKDGLYHMVYFKNTFGFNYQSKQNSNQLTYHSIGGYVHFLIFVGQKNPEPLIRHYHSYIGGIHIPPFWSLGWHQSRWGYRSLTQMKQVLAGYNKAGIPIDTIWSDLDYMKDKAIFTLDQSTYPAKDFREFLEKQNLHWVPLIDVGVYIGDTESTEMGKKMNVFIKTKDRHDVQYLAQVWPGAVHFVDYLHPNASKYWQLQLERLHKLVPFSGVWLDMNEPSNFNGNRPIAETYKIQHQEMINQMTIDNDLPHFCYEIQKCAEPNNPHGTFQHKEVHAYYGHLSTIPTYNFLEKHGRPFIISRSNSVGSGRFAGHWTGDNVAEWEFLRLSIGGNFLFQIFGIQMVGADICGFHKNTNEQLCGRWMQLGSLYPFSRSHNENESTSQEPTVLGEKVEITSRQVLRDRYSLLKQMYTYMVNLNGTGSFFRPLFFEFYEDSQLMGMKDVIETQFLIGRNIMSAPIVQRGHTSRYVYFPGKDELWYDITNVPKSIQKNKDQAEIPRSYVGQSSSTIINELPAPIPMFLRAGSMIFCNQPTLRSKDLNSEFLVLVALSDKNLTAKGQILNIQDYNKEESIQHCLSKGCLLSVQIKKEQDNFTINWKGGSQDGIVIQMIRLWLNQKQWKLDSALTIKGQEGQQSIEMKQATE